jgi:hypothetical protein
MGHGISGMTQLSAGSTLAAMFAGGILVATLLMKRTQIHARGGVHVCITGRTIAASMFTSLLIATGALAQGPVATACKDDIPKLCAGKEHGQGEVRACIEANKDKVSAACKAALDSTGPGKGMGQGQPK